MGIPRPFKPPKSPTTVVDPGPPVFNKHDDLHKGHKPGHPHNGKQPNRVQSYPATDNSRSNNNARNSDSTTASTASTSVSGHNKPTKASTLPSSSSGGSNTTASTDLWIASANASAAAAAANRKTERSSPVSGLPASFDDQPGRSQQIQKDSSHTLESYYEEEVLEDVDENTSYYTEDFMENEHVNGGANAGESELNLFPERNPTIRFDEYDEMQTVLHINDYTKYEINKSWYKRADYDKMVQLARKTAEKAEQRKRELEEDEQDGLRQELETTQDEDDQEHQRQLAATTNAKTIPKSSQRSHVGSVGSHHTRSSRGTSRGGGGMSIASDDSYHTTEDDDEDLDPIGDDHDDEQSTASKYSRRSNHSKRSRSSGGSGSGGYLDQNRNAKDASVDNESTGKSHDDAKKKEKKKPIEYRGLEAWTASGAAKVKLLKESSIELVWNEQSNQWDNGTFDAERIREVYVAVSETAQRAAYERGKNDALIVQKLLEMDRLAAEKKKRRKILGRSKALVKKSVKMTGRGVQQTGKLMKKTTKVTTKVAKEATKRSLKAGMATATLDPRMMKEALKMSKKRECRHELIRKPSQSHIQEHREGETWNGVLLYL